MITLQGKFNTAKVFTDDIEQEAISQIIGFCNQSAFAGSKIRIMPDVHAGAGCTIGTTMTITDKVVPNIVGVDIGCGMLVAELGKIDIDFAKLDAAIRRDIPSGFGIRNKIHPYLANTKVDDVLCIDYIDIDRAYRSVGSLGGGNHFIEVDEDEEGNKYLVIHSGSRHLGAEAAKYYQKEAYKDLSRKFGADKRDEIIAKCKAEHRERDIESELKALASQRPSNFDEAFAYCEGPWFDAYIHDMKIIQEYADWNRKAMLDVISKGMGFEIKSSFTTIHNYIDMQTMILRKGAVSAQKGERLIIPMNMRDGSLICIGKGNPDWNYSAPHGAGRLMSRSKAKEYISLNEFQNSMQGIWTTSVGTSTIDESPMAYKPMESILSNIGDTVDVEKIIKPLYNFKAGEEILAAKAYNQK